MSEQKVGVSQNEVYKKQYEDYLEFMEKNELGKSTLNSFLHREFDKIPIAKREEILWIVLSVLLAGLIIESYVILNMMM